MASSISAPFSSSPAVSLRRRLLRSPTAPCRLLPSLLRQIADLSCAASAPTKLVEKDPIKLWHRYVDWLYQHKELGLFLDVRRIGFTDEFFDSMEPRMQRAFQAMRDLAIVVAPGSDHRRVTNVSAILDAQQKKLNLPILPTTTIGPLPQTVELRRVRREYKANKISEEEYVSAIKEEISKVVKLQEELNNDVLVHGEPEDYTGEDVTVNNLFAFLLGNKAALSGGSGKVVDSGPNVPTISRSGIAMNTYKNYQIDVIRAEWVDYATPYIKSYVSNT